MHPTEKEACIP